MTKYSRIRTRFMLVQIALDSVVAYASVYISSLLGVKAPAVLLLTFAVLSAISIPLLFGFTGLYRTRRLIKRSRDLFAVIKTISIYIIIIFLLDSLFFRVLPSRIALSVFAGVSIVLITSTRWILEWIRRALRTKGADVSNALIIGTNETAKHIAFSIHEKIRRGYNVVGFLSLEKNPPSSINEHKCFGNIDELENVIQQQHIDEVIVCEPSWEAAKLVEMIALLREKGFKVWIVSALFDSVLEQTPLVFDRLDGLPIIDFNATKHSAPTRAVKRIIDILGALIAIILGSALWLAIAAAIYIEDRGKIIFHHTRIKKDAAPFKFYKFRSMVINAEAQKQELAKNNERSGQAFKIKNDPRITKTGAFIRKYSLDEFPQLLNVLKGDMSLIGPRPATPDEVKEYETWHRIRLDGVAGCSGLWQVSGRADLSFNDMVLLDILYLCNQSVFLDCELILRTFSTIVMAKGAY